ncbi:MAG TPA: glycosyltransferase [Rhodocyclaceae bacterium]|jgi:glycosyltransferase involved in cell wall biosynthesis
MNDRLRYDALDGEFQELDRKMSRSAAPALHIALVAGNGPTAFPLAPELAEDLRHLGQRVQLIRPRKHKWEHPGSADRFQEVLLPRHPSPARLVYHWGQNRPDIVHVLDGGYLGWAATHTARQMGLPVSVGYSGQLGRSTPTTPQRISDRWQQKLAQGWQRHICNSAHALLANTFTDAQLLRSQGLHNIKISPRGIDLHHWNPRQRSLSLRHQWGIRAETPVLAHLGPVDDAQTINCLRTTMAALLAQHPQARLLLIEAGRIPTRLQALRPLRSEDWRDQPLGRRSGERKPTLAALLASADILLIPHPEARPELIPHALACGLTVIARRNELSQTFIEDGHNGFLVDVKDTAPGASAAGYAEAITQLNNHPTTEPRLRLRAPASVAHLERSHAADQLIRVFREVAQGHARCQRAAQGLVVMLD